MDFEHVLTCSSRELVDALVSEELDPDQVFRQEDGSEISLLSYIAGNTVSDTAVKLENLINVKYTTTIVPT